MFSDIAVGIKTFLRDDKLYKAIDGIRRNLPEAQMIIADDGYIHTKKQKLYYELADEGHTILECAFDSGFGHKSNRIADHLTRPYLLIGSDDFDFTPQACTGVYRLQEVLEVTDIDNTSGRVRSRPYEFNLEINDEVVTEHPVNPTRPITVVDLTVNYSMIKRHVFDKVRWDDDVKIGGGEHGAFFYDVKLAGYKVAYIDGVNIDEQNHQDTHLYRSYRSRSISKARPCFVKRGIKKYILGTGEVDYDSKLS